MKPSERFLRNHQSLRADGVQASDTEIFCGSVAAYLDVEYERRAAFEADVLKRLAAVESKTSSTAVVEVTEVLNVGPDFEHGRTLRLRWPEPEGHKHRDAREQT